MRGPVVCCLILSALLACSVDRTPSTTAATRDPLRQATATATLRAAGTSSLSASAAFVETGESVDLSITLRGCVDPAGYRIRILAARSCDDVSRTSAPLHDDGIPTLLCTAGNSGEGRLSYMRSSNVAARWSVGDGSRADVVGRTIAVFDLATSEPLACGAIAAGEDRMLVAQPPIDQPPSLEARAVVAGLCALQVSGPASDCVDPAAIAACATEHCELGACLAKCEDYATCADATSEACMATSMCALSDECFACQTDLVSCSLAWCGAHFTCPSVPAPDGACASMMACCALQGDRAATCLSTAGFSAIVAGEPTCINALSDWDVLAHQHVPCDTAAAFAHAVAAPPGSRPSTPLEGPSCWTPADCSERELCVGAVRLPTFVSTGRCLAREPTTPLEDGVAGWACTSDSACDGGTCEVATPLRTPFPGGYCSSPCYEDETCGAGGVCVMPRGSAEPGRCFQRCDGDEACARDGYRCTPLGDGERVVGACYPRRDALPDGLAGSACTQGADCAASAAECRDGVPLAFLNGEVVATPGGYCTVPCLFDIDCGEQAQCVTGGVSGGLCMARCNDAAPCRDGYECYAHLRDGDPAAKVCVPKWRDE